MQVFVGTDRPSICLEWCGTECRKLKGGSIVATTIIIVFSIFNIDKTSIVVEMVLMESPSVKKCGRVN